MPAHGSWTTATLRRSPRIGRCNLDVEHRARAVDDLSLEHREIHSRLAPSIRERAWHPSQRLKDRADGSVVLGEGGQLPAFADDTQPPLPFAFARLGGA